MPNALESARFHSHAISCPLAHLVASFLEIYLKLNRIAATISVWDTVISHLEYCLSFLKQSLFLKWVYSCVLCQSILYVSGRILLLKYISEYFFLLLKNFQWLHIFFRLKSRVLSIAYIHQHGLPASNLYILMCYPPCFLTNSSHILLFLEYTKYALATGPSYFFLLLSNPGTSYVKILLLPNFRKLRSGISLCVCNTHNQSQVALNIQILIFLSETIISMLSGINKDLKFHCQFRSNFRTKWGQFRFCCQMIYKKIIFRALGILELQMRDFGSVTIHGLLPYFFSIFIRWSLGSQGRSLSNRLFSFRASLACRKCPVKNYWKKKWISNHFSLNYVLFRRQCDQFKNSWPL